MCVVVDSGIGAQARREPYRWQSLGLGLAECLDLDQKGVIHWASQSLQHRTGKLAGWLVAAPSCAGCLKMTRGCAVAVLERECQLSIDSEDGSGSDFGRQGNFNLTQAV